MSETLEEALTFLVNVAGVYLILAGVLALLVIMFALVILFRTKDRF